jgi:hypothetical protein
MKARIAALMLAAAMLYGQVSVGSGTKTVTTAGTAVTLTASNNVVKWVTIQALSSNTGAICIGGSTVLASSKNGTCITAGQAAPMYFMGGFPYDLSNIYIDSAVGGEGVSYTYAR